jgi:replicative DNA helicase
MTILNEQQVSEILSRNKVKTDNVNCDITLDQIESFSNKDNIKKMYQDIVKYNKMLDEKITFVNEDLTNVIPFTRENLYLMCAYTGSGKSTVAANITFPLWKQGKKCLVVTNEEPQQDVMYRIACLELGYNFNAYKKGEMTQEHMIECMKLFPEISKYIKVIDVAFNGGMTTRLEGVINILNNLKTTDYSCVLIDYYQLIQYSVKDPSRSRYDVLNDLRIFLQLYIRDSNVPVVIFAQLHSMGKRKNEDLDSRVKECPTILECATVVIEIVPNFEESTTDFIIRKDRFGKAGHKIVCGFERGRYVEFDEDFKQRSIQRRLNALTKGIAADAVKGDE